MLLAAYHHFLTKFHFSCGANCFTFEGEWHEKRFRKSKILIVRDFHRKEKTFAFVWTIIRQIKLTQNAQLFRRWLKFPANCLQTITDAFKLYSAERCDKLEIWKLTKLFQLIAQTLYRHRLALCRLSVCSVVYFSLFRLYFRVSPCLAANKRFIISKFQRAVVSVEATSSNMRLPGIRECCWCCAGKLHLHFSSCFCRADENFPSFASVRCGLKLGNSRH